MFRPRPQHAPRRKFRGKRRYFRAVRARAAGFDLDVGPTAWWNLWHWHADWCGWGNLRGTYRRAHIEALCAVFRTITRRAPDFHTPFQLWILLDGEDAGGDAVFLHTPNPHGGFPVSAPETVPDTTTLRDVFTSLLPGLTLRCGWSRHAGEDDDGRERWCTRYWVWAEGVGLPLWSADTHSPSEGEAHSQTPP